MRSELIQFVNKYLPIVAGTFLAVSFVAFVTIPYVLGNASGALKADQLTPSASSTTL